MYFDLCINELLLLTYTKPLYKPSKDCCKFCNANIFYDCNVWNSNDSFLTVPIRVDTKYAGSILDPDPDPPDP
jgi:hypothetical protein